MRLSLGFFVVSVAVLVSETLFAQSANVEPIRIASPYPKDTPIGIAVDSLASDLQKSLAGYYQVTVVNRLNSSLDAINSKEFQLSVVPSTDLNRISDNAFSLYDLPFLFASSRELAAVQQTEGGNIPFAMFQRKTGIIGLGYLNNGFNNLVIYSAVNDVSGLKGKTVSVSSQASRIALQGFGVTPRQVVFAELSSAVQAGAIDGFESSPTLAWDILKRRAFDKSPITALPMRPNVAAFVVSEFTWKSLSYRAQIAIKEATENAEIKSTTEAARREAEAANFFFQSQMTNSADFGAFYKSAQPSWHLPTGTPEASRLNNILPIIEQIRANSPPSNTPPGRRGSIEPTVGAASHAALSPTGEVLFATDRRVESDPDPRFRIGSNRGQLAYGVTRFNISAQRPMGNVDSNLSQLADVDELREASFLSHVSDRLSRSPKNELLIFVHGFNNTFEDAARSLALFSEDVKLGAVPILFSWPSDGIALRYPSDEEEVRASRNNFLMFLRSIKSQTGANQIHVAAHSMGSRLILEALDRFDTEHASDNNILFGHLILAAPDVYTEIFSQTIEAIKRRSKRVTLYVSENDSALKCSKSLHGNRRLGEAGSIPFLAPGIDTIDATNVEPPPPPTRAWWDFLSYLFIDACRSGHAYMIRSIRVQADVQNLVQNNLRPVDRYGIIEKQSGSLTYWQFKRADRDR
ncbi:MAG: TRAP transporter substrate-binding protein DctP [Telmatospirillum sp.]|nr:TRAP transporter substrate-binding protein DctP [Telmatospirillum sp.]